MRALRFVSLMVVILFWLSVFGVAASSGMEDANIVFEPMNTSSSLQLFRVVEGCPDLQIENAWDNETTLYRCPALRVMVVANTHAAESFVAYISTKDPEAAVFRNYPGFLNLNWISDDGMQLSTWDIRADWIRYWFAVKGYGITEHPQGEEIFMMRGLHVDPWGGHLCMFAGDDAPSDEVIQGLLGLFADGKELDFDEVQHTYPRHCLS